MPDREKVIQGMKSCTGTCKSSCPYHSKGCLKELHNDALALLKEYVYGIRYVPVVRCYECQYWEPENAEEGDCSGHCRKRYGMSEGNVTDGTWFCSDGERDTDD